MYAGRAHHDLGRRQVAAAGLLGQAEVGDFGCTFFVVEDVAGLEVAVDDPPIVSCLDGTSERRDQLRRGLGREPVGPGEPFGQAAAGKVLHREERPAVGIAVLVHLHNVGMLDGGDRLGLSEESDQLLGPGPLFAQHHLHGDQPVEPHLAGLPDRPHPAFSERRKHVVAGDGRHRHGVRQVGRVTRPS